MNRLLTVGVAGLLMLGLSACHDGDHANVGLNPSAPAASAVSLYAPVAQDAVLPFPSDLLFVDADNMSGLLVGLSADGTLNAPGGQSNPLIAQLDRIDGFSTTTDLYADFKGPSIDVDSANDGAVRVVDLSTGKALVAGQDFKVILSPVVTDDQRLLIEPLRPLAPGQVYGVVITDGLKTSDGGAVTPSAQFAVVASADKVGSQGNPASGYSAAQKQELSVVRQSFVRPLLSAAGVSASDAVVAWRFTTQTIGASLADIAANPAVNPDQDADGGIRVKPLSLATVESTKIGSAFVNKSTNVTYYQGTVDLAYYLPDANSSDSNNDGETPLDGFWRNNGVAAEGNANLHALNGQAVACSQVSAPASTTACYPVPKMRSVQSVPVIVAVPNDNSPSHGNPPAGGWPVVVFQHGLTGDRSEIFAVAPAFAAKGFVTVAIDLPLHGLPPSSPLYIKGHERTFDLPARDGSGVASSGTYFTNLQSLITLRDDLREAVADEIDLAATLKQDGRIPVSGGNAIALNGAAPQFVGHSLGAITGSTLAGVTSDNLIDGVTLANPGGGLVGLLDGSAELGPSISSALAAAGIQQGTQSYEDYERLAQTLIDPGDPINYAAAAPKNHPLQMIEVVGGGNGGENAPDLVVPNAVPANVSAQFMPPVNGACPATGNYTPALDTVCVGWPLSGTNPLVSAMGLSSTTLTVPYASATVADDRVLRFESGAHSTFITPTAGTGGADAPAHVDPQDGAAAHAEMLCQTAGFFANVARGDKNPMIPLGCANGS